MFVSALSRLLPAAVLVLVASECLCGTAWAQAGSPRTVLTIHAGAEDHPSNPVLDLAIRHAIATHDDEQIDYFTEYLESDRFQPEQSSSALADYIREKYRDRRIDLVIAMTDMSLAFALNHRGVLFPDAPIVAAGLAAPSDAIRMADPGVTAMTVGNAYAATLKLALDLHPTTKQVFVIANSESRQSTETVRAELREFSGRVAVTYIEEQTLPRLLEAVRAVPPQSLILYVWHYLQEHGTVVYPDQIARLVAEAAPVPVYGTSDLYIGLGLIGGVVRSTRDTGARLGETAVEVLRGKRPQDIPVTSARVVPTFDWRQLRRWGVDESRLPLGSDVQHRLPTAWETYRHYILGTMVVVAAQLLLIAGLIAQRSRRRRAEETIRAREATLRTSYERIRQMTGRLINAQEAARAGVARDLHDDVCQQLVYVSMTVSGIKNSSGRIEDADTQQAFGKLENETLGIYDTIRRLSHELHPSTLHLLGLAPTLKGHCREVEKRQGVQIDLKTEGDFRRLHPDVAVCLFRMAQEAIRNGIAHGDAKRFVVSLIRSGDHVELIVTDDGRGFDLDAVRRAGRGLGLVSMEERAHVIGASVKIVTAPGQGTTVHVRAQAEGATGPQPPEATAAAFP